MSDNSFENIYYLGPDGSNTQSAMFKFLETCNIKVQNRIPQKTIKSALDELVKNPASICVIPIENSIEGIVRETIDNLLKVKNNTIKIQGEISIPIKHLLLAKTSNKNQIKTIISHPQALAQCSKYLYENFQNADIKDVSSTSYAAQKVSESDDLTIAAIANETSAKLFKLNILSDDINDEKDNKTRFYILSSKKLSKREEGKTSIIFSTPNESGALCQALQILYKHKINITYIDSRPSKKKLGEYVFFIEIDGHEDNTKIKTALQELMSFVDFIKILGSYQVY